jgi:hypothetical protein
MSSTGKGLGLDANASALLRRGEKLPKYLGCDKRAPPLRTCK